MLASGKSGTIVSAQAHRQRRPVEEGRIDHFDPGQPALIVELHSMHDRPPPALDDPHPAGGGLVTAAALDPGHCVETFAAPDEVGQE